MLISTGEIKGSVCGVLCRFVFVKLGQHAAVCLFWQEYTRTLVPPASSDRIKWLILSASRFDGVCVCLHVLPVCECSDAWASNCGCACNCVWKRMWLLGWASACWLGSAGRAVPVEVLHADLTRASTHAAKNVSKHVRLSCTHFCLCMRVHAALTPRRYTLTGHFMSSTLIHNFMQVSDQPIVLWCHNT